jgi:class 3 adenylate cyclase
MELNDSLKTKETAKELEQMAFAKQVLADSLKREEEKLRIQMEHEAEVRRKNTTRNIFIISAVFLLLGVIGIYRRMVFTRRAKKAIESEKERSDNLLLNILPSEIAEELKEKGRADARNFEKVSILFTDFRRFTEISEKLSAEELVSEINTCFEKFDSICQKYGIEKIKTIGDSYMAAGGLPIPSEDSARNTVLAGLEMAECMVNHKKESDAMDKTSFEMRVGIHTGPVVAGIVGTTKFQYDIWGDTVNTASRIESSGEVGKVNISAATYEAIKDEPSFNYKYRGKIKTKGKGEMDMWFVERTGTTS